MLLFKFKLPTPVSLEDTNNNNEPEISSTSLTPTEKQKSISQKSRSPASFNRTYERRTKISKKDPNIFKKNEIPPSTTDSYATNFNNSHNEPNSRESAVSDFSSSIPFYAANVPSLDTVLPLQEKTATTSSSYVTPEAVGNQGTKANNIIAAATKNNVIKKDNSSNSFNSSSYVPSESTSLVCNADITGGVFSSALAVNISCQVSATIKYCLSKGTCCDPITSGNIYTAPVAIGVGNGNGGSGSGNYCLSYYGESPNAGDSEIVRGNYQINLNVPDLQVVNSQLYYQTTELADMSYVSSYDFGKPGYSIGQINLRNRNPGPDGDDLSCDEIINQYSSFASPAAFVTQILMDVSGLNSLTDQVEIPLQLEYSDNYITNYMVNNNLAVPVYACSNSRIKLEDFEFFTNEPISGETGTVSVREFSAGFTPYGFFEDDVTVYRGPAGVGNQVVSQQKLESGLFEVFY